MISIIRNADLKQVQICELVSSFERDPASQIFPSILSCKHFRMDSEIGKNCALVHLRSLAYVSSTNIAGSH